MIELIWQNDEAKGWRDRFAPSAFAGDHQAVTHECYSPSGERVEAQCLLSVSGRTATLDYAHESTRTINDRAEIYPDILQLEFADDSRSELRSVWFVIDGERALADVSINNDADAVYEGDPVLVAHLRRERDTGQRQRKLDRMKMEHGRIFCELCGDDRAIVYAGVSADRIYEVHHLKPLSAGRQRVELDDLAVLCACCHRAVHGLNPLPADVDSLRRGIIGSRGPL